ncbi:MAG: hypothetical protein J6K21_00180 [Bacilli bacterium]|nr:hypothetical protein [Bacilli bacterium]
MKIKIVNNLLYIFIGVIMTLGITVLAVNYNASDMIYKDSTVEKALNELYNNNDKCISSTIFHEANSQINIPIGFTPSNFIISYNNSQGYVYFIYNKNVSDVIYSFSKSAKTVANSNSNFSISNSIVSNYASSYMTYKEEYEIHYTACK